MILPRHHIKDLYRFPPDTESHEPYLCLDRNERVIDFPEEIVQRFYELLNPRAIMAYPEIEPLQKKLADYIDVPKNHFFLLILILIMIRINDPQHKKFLFLILILIEQ